ncbi:MAG: two-component system response regulator [Ignavibacteria bacterium]
MTKILIVDDDPIVRAMLKDVLTQASFIVQLASNGNEALDIILSSSPDLVLLDIEMPGMNGIDVLKKIRLQRETRRLPVMFLTGAPLDPTRTVEVLELDPDDIVTKVISSKELVARIQWVLRRHELDRQEERSR